MKKIISTLFLIIIFAASTFAQEADAEGCKDSPMFPNRMPNYLISECKSNFDAVEFNLAPSGTKVVTKEGTNTHIQYNYNAESGQPKPSPLQILRNYEAAVKKIGGTTVLLKPGEDIATFKILKNGKESVWVKVECGGNDGNDFYVLTILQLEEMKQEVTSADILTALNTTGYIALYINFATGKADIAPESQKAVDEIAEMLKKNPSLKISVEGHTDNVGTPATNKTLSEKRAQAIMASIISKGIDKSRLMAKGWGQDKPVGDNRNEEGKAKNRRVEIVKI